MDPSGTWCLPAQYFTAERFVEGERVAPSATLTVCEGMQAFAGKPYAIPFTVNNPTEPQSSPNVMLSATSEQVTRLNPKPRTLNPRLQTLNPRPTTLDPEPQTLNPKPEILDPKP